MSTGVNIAAWGQPVTTYTTNNVRTGASDLTDPDFVNYPPFVRNSFDTQLSYTWLRTGDLYYPYLDGNTVTNLNKPIDTSIAYCACKNYDIPINNIFGYALPPDSSGGYGKITAEKVTGVTEFTFIKSKPEPIPIMFLQSEGYIEARSHQSSLDALNGVYYNPIYMTSSGIYHQQRIWTPYAVNTNSSGEEGNPTTAAGLLKSNRNLFMGYWRDFGIRSLYLIIYVRYVTGYSSSTNLPTTSTNTLKWYESQTDEWRETHPMCGAYATMHMRRNVNGEYGTLNVTNQGGFKPDLTLNLISNFSYGSIQQGDFMCQPIANCLTGYSNDILPIFGHVAANNFATSGMGNQNSSQGTTTSIAWLIGGTANDHISHRAGKENTQYERDIWCELDGTSENCELIRKWCAAYGLFFCDDITYGFDNAVDETRWTDENMCLGVVDDEGYTDGTYTRGAGNTSANNFEWKTASESKYDPSRPPPSPENQYSTETTFNSIGDVATMTKRYVLTGATVKLLAHQLWTITENMINVGGNIDFSELSNKLLDQFLTSNPIDCIVSLQRYPMEIPAVGDTTIVLGKYDTSLHAKPMEKTAFFYLFYGNTIQPKFGDSFLDYQPFTKMELYVPFCGTIQLNPADILGRKLNVQLVVDFTTGTATGFVMSDNLVIETVNGNIAIDIPVTGIQQTTVASNLYNAIAQRSNAYKQEDITGWNRVSLGGALEMFWGDVMGASDTFGIKGKKTLQREIAATNREKADYDLTHQSAPVHIIGSASPAGGWAIDLNCRLLIYYPTGDVIRDANPPKWNNLQLARYGRTTGFACCIEKAIGEMGSGLVVGTAPRLDLMTTNTLHNPATIEELDMIRAAIEEGVILPTITE